jgi:hypothetical protein
MMELNADIRLKELLVFLRDNFGIALHAIDKKGLPPLETQIFKSLKVKRPKFFNVDESSTIGEIDFLLKIHADLHVNFRNNNGVKLPAQISLKASRDFTMSASGNSKLLETSLLSAISLAKKHALNADLDWVYRILKNAAYELKTSEDKVLMVKALVEICEISPDISVNILSAIVNIFCVTDIDRSTMLREMSYSSSDKVAQMIAIIERDDKQRARE